MREPDNPTSPALLPRAGVGLKPQHYRDILDSRPRIGFFEVHAENYMGDGGPPHRYLEAIRAQYPLSVHGVGLSLGSSRPIDRAHLARLARLIDRYQPESFSEHLAWSSHGSCYLNDLLPLPYTQETLLRLCSHIDEVQEALGRRMLLENPATYVHFEQSTLSETDFLAAIVERTGCALLLDVNNVFVSATNHGGDALAYLDAFPMGAVREIHLAGCSDDGAAGRRLLIDDHGSPVRADVWALYQRVIDRIGPMPTLIEWDNDVPAWPALLAEAMQAQRLLERQSDRRSRVEQVDAVVG
jgi:uncharacterized protein (UPF0276 family)